MIDEFFDAASANEVISVLRRGSEHIRPSAACTALEVTCLLIKPSPFQIAPDVQKTASAAGEYGSMLQQLRRDMIIYDQGGGLVTSEPISTTKELIRIHQPVLNQYFSQLRGADEFKDWLDEGVHCIWPEHAHRLGGLYDQKFIPEIALISNRDEADLISAWPRASNSGKMEAFTKEHAQNSEEFQLLSDAFAASALVRGVAHDQQAQALGGAQILHHPMRRSILSKLQEQPVSVVEIDPDPQRFLANAGLAYALTEKDLDRRIGAWVDFIAKIRSLANSREITLHGEALDEDSAKGIAVEALRRAGVTQWSRREDNIYDALWTAFSNFLTCFVLTQGYAFSAGVTLTYIGQRAKAGVARVTGGRASQLDNLAERGPGRLNGEWRHSSLYETL